MVSLSVIYYLDEKKKIDFVATHTVEIALERRGEKYFAKAEKFLQFLEGLEFLKSLNNTQHLKFSVTL